MGIGFGISTSSFDEPTKGNPNPQKFEIIWEENYYDHLILVVKYPDCTNYEGKKILLFDEGVTKKEIVRQGMIDPHFSDNPNYISPIARFVPTKKGLNLAKLLAEHIYER